MWQRLWAFCCSLKLAIWLASLATLLLMGGSLLVPAHPAIFGRMDELPFGRWLDSVAAAEFALTWWFWLAALGLLLLGLNTCCCFCDWLLHLRGRWRKSGEYLLHLGVVLVIAAYLWGSLAGERNNGLRILVGEQVELTALPGHVLRLDSFRPVFGAAGPPRDMISAVTLLNGAEELVSAEVRINRPLLRDGLVVTPVSFGRLPVGLSFRDRQGREREIRAGDVLALANGSQVSFLRFVPDLQRLPDGRLRQNSERLGMPAYEIRVAYREGGDWQGWYFPTAGLPRELRMAGFALRPAAPLYRDYSVLTVNYDPGATLAAAGGGLMMLGVVIALFSFYRKRSANDRPDI